MIHDLPIPKLESLLICASADILTRAECGDVGYGFTIRLLLGRRVRELNPNHDDVRHACDEAQQLMSHGPRLSSNGDDAREKLLLSILFSEEEVAVLRALADGDQSADTIARKLGRQGPDTKLRGILSNLVQRGVLASTTNGYAVANKKILDFLPPA